MNKNDTDFDTWFDCMAMNVLDRTGVEPRDRDAFREVYESGKDLFDAADEVAAEYGEIE